MPGLEAEWPDIQGNILRPYAHAHARYATVRINEGPGARRLLASLLDQRLITTAAPWAPGEKPDATLNVYFSWHGLAAVGVPQASLDSFPQEFRQGMAARWQLLRDPDPAGWEFGGDSGQADVFFAVYGNTVAHVEARLDAVRAELAQVPGALTVTHRQDAAMLARHTEHFGFADGFGQPQIAGSGAPEYRGDGTPVGANGWVPLEPGEFILGHPNETGFPGPTLFPPLLGRNGSFMAYRKMEQDVPAFRALLRAEAARLYGSSAPENVERLAAKLVGRWRSGCPLMLSPERDDLLLAEQWGINNDFRYAADPRGATCPLGSHIRRMNPRDGLSDGTATLVRTHRIVRRGMPYGDWLEDDNGDSKERGISFMAVNASLAYQFELVHQDWTNSGEFAGLDAQDVDPFNGEPREGSRFRIPQASGPPRRIYNMPRFTTLRGGGYFFIPSLTALRFIAGQQT